MRISWWISGIRQKDKSQFVGQLDEITLLDITVHLGLVFFYHRMYYS